MRALLWYNFRLSPHVYHPFQHILEPTTVAMGKSLFEKQNWYYRDHLRRFQCVDRYGEQVETWKS